MSMGEGDSSLKEHKRSKKNKKASKEHVPDKTIDEIAEKKSRKVKEDKHRKSTDARVLETTNQSPLDAEHKNSPTKDRKRKVEPEETSGEQSVHKAKKKKRDRHLDVTTPSSINAVDAQSSVPVTPPTPVSPEAQSFLEEHSITITTPPSIPLLAPIISFDQLDIAPGLKAAFKGFKEPTPIQAAAWPWALNGRDVIGIAETGSGKTLAFGIPALAQLISGPSSVSVKSGKKNKKPTRNTSVISVLVVAPTRELAIQTHDTLSVLGASFGIGSVAVYGGVDKVSQVKALSSAREDGKMTRIVVGTPGRILDLVNDGTCDLSGVNYLVLDEADRMLDKGFENDITAIISRTMRGSERQTMMFSATWPESVRRLANSFLRDPVRVTVGSDDLTANGHVEQFIEVLDDTREKDALLAKYLASLAPVLRNGAAAAPVRVLIFALYKQEAGRVEATLKRAGHDVGTLHGDMAQNARMAALERFKSGWDIGEEHAQKRKKTMGLRLLVATDVAARGLDIPGVEAVVNYTFPLTIEDYIHRIGRTGRGGRTGRAITFFTGDSHERALAGELARVLRDAGFGNEADKLHKFPMTIKKKTHSAYGAFFRDDVRGAPTKIVF